MWAILDVIHVSRVTFVTIQALLNTLRRIFDHHAMVLNIDLSCGNSAFSFLDVAGRLPGV